MKKNGFTFIEILGVITVLALISTIILISVSKSLKESKEKLYQVEIENIKSAASMWKTDNIELIPDNGYYLITLKDLQDNGYIKEDLINPKTNENFDKTLLIEIGMNEIQANDELIKNGYQKLEYIESTGKQYIDTGYVPKIGDTYNMIFQPLLLDKNQVFLGSRTTGTWTTSLDQVYVNQSVNETITNGSENKLVFFSGTSYTEYATLSSNQIYNYNFDVSDGNYNEENTNSLYIFAFNNIDQVNAKSSIKLYELKIYNDGLIYDFVPCLRKSDNEAGLYDLVGHRFYTNDGTNSFVYEEL